MSFPNKNISEYARLKTLFLKPYENYSLPKQERDPRKCQHEYKKSWQLGVNMKQRTKLETKERPVRH